MNMLDITEALEEAERFIETAIAVKEKAKQDRYIFMGSKETAACKRASMDLTRALVAIRK